MKTKTSICTVKYVIHWNAAPLDGKFDGGLSIAEQIGYVVFRIAHAHYQIMTYENIIYQNIIY